MTLRERSAARAEDRGERAAQRVHGVKNVEDEVEVRPLPGHKREDAELRGAVLQALALDSVVPQTVEADVEDGKVTLSGTAAWQLERDEAEYVTNDILGVVRVHNEIELSGPPPNARQGSGLHPGCNAPERRHRSRPDPDQDLRRHGHPVGHGRLVGRT